MYCVCVCESAVYETATISTLYNETEWMTMKTEIQSHQKFRLLLFVDDMRRTRINTLHILYIILWHIVNAARIYLGQRLTFIDLV